MRAYAFYGDFRQPGTAQGTLIGVTGALPEADVSYGAGDGIVLAASVLGLPINGSPGVPGIADRLVRKVDLGPTHHQALFSAAGPQVADALLDRRIGDAADPLGAYAVRTPLPSATAGDREVPAGELLEPALHEGNP